MGTRAAAAVLAIALAAVVAGPAQAADHKVAFPATAPSGPYVPSSLDIPAHDTVTFSGSFSFHPLVWDKGEFPTQSSGTSHTYAFEQAGTYKYHCEIHP